jgi:hypothetical protein
LALVLEPSSQRDPKVGQSILIMAVPPKLILLLSLRASMADLIPEKWRQSPTSKSAMGE